jgi:hypothetical protein
MVANSRTSSPTNPTSDTAVILDGTGNGSPIQAQQGGYTTPIPAQVIQDNNLLAPAQVANAGNSAGQGLAYPDLNAVFSAAVWLKPTSLGGTAVSINGTNTAAFKIFTDATTKSWRAALTRSDTTGPTTDTAIGPPGSAIPGVWTHVGVSYSPTATLLTLFVNDTRVATVAHPTAWAASGGIQIGDERTNATTYANFYAGLCLVPTDLEHHAQSRPAHYRHLLPPAQPADPVCGERALFVPI